MSTTTSRRATGGLIALLFGLMTAAVFAGPVSADGKPGTYEADCGSGQTLQGNQDTLSYTDPQGRDILGVCIKSGSNMFSDGHSDSIDADGTVAGCYQVQGVSGTGASVTVTRTGDGPSCQGISHVDIVLGSANTGGGGQVTLCHLQGGTFTILTVAAAEEAAHRAHGDVNPNTAGTCTSGGTSGGATVTLCHMSGSTFALLTVPTTEEAAHRAHGDVNPNTAGACTNTTGGNTGGSGTAGGSGTLGGQGGPVRGGVAAGQGGPGGGVLPNTAVPAADFLTSIGGALLALSGIGFAAGRRLRD